VGNGPRRDAGHAEVTPVVFSDEARADALEAFAFYQGRKLGLGVRFRDHVDLAINRIREDPERYPIVYAGELRRRRVERFPYAIYFRVYPHLVYIVAVMHGRRSSDHWQRRGPSSDDA